MGEPKLSLELSPGVTLGSRGLREMWGCGLSQLVVVVRPEDPLLWLCDKEDARAMLPKLSIAPCRDAHLGMAHSLRAGLQALEADPPDAVLIALADQPFVSSLQLRRLIKIFNGSPQLDYVASGKGQTPMPPAILSRSIFPVLNGLEGDEGARGIFRNPDYRGAIARFAAEWSFVDVDTQEDLQHARMLWQAIQNSARNGTYA
ncbi:molybdenum cofactor cytidylyltransferase [Paenibacillus phyllosphaerae]|uniref:Molybdenum cofactor cytidylyltransferase n=1 Tax=Paenibacillus phyllosphaerae TaxID=274593 RepID=A0A7W5AZ17_9BACL|nr:nucleotidyltransferase family protein [Paenibacillus phyllosphaerae]MBB3111257.1 molybdenum cofactor cytidylyltransferase [Paenibacillus phyllosphaerae]